MNDTIANLKKVIRNFRSITVLENDIYIYLKSPDSSISKKLEKKKISLKHAYRLYYCIKQLRATVLNEIEKLDEVNKDVITDLCINGKSAQLTSIECYVGLTTVYRIINNFALRLYFILKDSRKFEKSVNYVINQLQNNL